VTALADGRRILAPERDAESPAPSAGLFSGLKRPPIQRLALRGYRRERIGEIFFPVATAMMQGGFIGVIAAKIFQVHPAVLALVSAAPMFGNVSSYAWARLAHGRRKIPFIVGLQACFLVLVAGIALAPVSAVGVWVLAGCLIASHLVLGGIVTLRSLIWTLNYPRDARGRVTWRLSVLATLMITLVSGVGGLLLDANAESFRLVYAGGALAALVGVIAFSGVRLVGEERQLALERGEELEQRDPDAQAGPRPSAWRVLRQDPLYVRYQTWQFLLGVSNMLIEAPLIYLLTIELGASFTQSIGLTLVLPMGLSIVTVPFWAGYLDRVHISEFRSRHSWLFAASQLLLWLGAANASLGMIAAARCILGLARGGGILAWQLGHNDFAAADRVGLYMGIHVTLTGIRGAFAPFLGMLLYVGWEPVVVPLFRVALPGFSGVGSSLMLAATCLSFVACTGYVSLHRSVSRRRR
jgi:hypothetical protein